ncbi:MAG: flagellar biosynthesis protein FlhB [Pseudomonadota bacterium]
MAENDTSQERTEQATPRRREEARNKGQVSRSRELTTMCLLLSSAVIFMILGKDLSIAMQELMQNNFKIHRDNIFDEYFLTNALLISSQNMLLGFAPVLLIFMLVAFFAPMLVGGWLFSPQAMQFKPDKINPISGLQRLFGMKTVMELFKTLAKFLLVTVISIAVLWFQVGEILNVGMDGLNPGLIQASDLVISSFIIVCLGTIVIALVDVPFQLWEQGKQLRMTKQQLKDEMKETEGKPEVKQHIRQLQMEMANRRMMEAIPEADVIITNPTHYAVALSYKPDEMSAPLLVAKGADLVAERIRQIATEHNVMLFPSPMLARAIYFNTKINQEVPSGLYIAVAQVLAYVFQLRDQFKYGQKPKPPTDLPIPDELKHD